MVESEQVDREALMRAIKQLSQAIGENREYAVLLIFAISETPKDKPKDAHAYLFKRSTAEVHEVCDRLEEMATITIGQFHDSRCGDPHGLDRDGLSEAN